MPKLFPTRATTKTFKFFDIIYYCVPEESEARLDKKLHNIGFFSSSEGATGRGEPKNWVKNFAQFFFAGGVFPKKKRAIIVREREIF